MLSEIYYLIRLRTDGSYLVAHPRAEQSSYLLLFSENFDALSYLNTHAPADMANRFTVESIPSTQLGALLKRWGFKGVGVVQDPLLPKIEFLSHV